MPAYFAFRNCHQAFLLFLVSACASKYFQNNLSLLWLENCLTKLDILIKTKTAMYTFAFLSKLYKAPTKQTEKRKSDKFVSKMTQIINWKWKISKSENEERECSKWTKICMQIILVQFFKIISILVSLSFYCDHLSIYIVSVFKFFPILV